MSETILVAPTAFKGTFGSRQVADALAEGARSVLPHAAVLTCPVADGGDGLLDAVLGPTALREHLSVTGPLGVPVQAELGWIDAETAIFESASACGLALLSPDRRNPLEATSRGVGELLIEAADRAARTIIVGLGGSASVDGGVGAARGLGWTFRDVNGALLSEGGGALTELADWSTGWDFGARVLALTDVRTPLVGPEGAAPIFAPQKGASPAAVERLAAGLDRLAGAMAASGRGELAMLAGGGGPRRRAGLLRPRRPRPGIGVGARPHRVRCGARQGRPRDHRGGCVRRDVAARQGDGGGDQAGEGRAQESRPGGRPGHAVRRRVDRGGRRPDPRCASARRPRGPRDARRVRVARAMSGFYTSRLLCP